jgi:F0F1-type ATP synthase delta subunit
MQVATYTQVQSNLSFAAGGTAADLQALLAPEGTDNALLPASQAVSDLLDIQSGLQEQMLQATQRIQQAFSDPSLTQEEQFAVFAEEAAALFGSLLNSMQSMIENGSLDALAGEMGVAKESFFMLEASLSIEVTTVSVTQQPANDLSFEALTAVNSAQIAEQEKETMLQLVAMIDEFIQSPARDHLLRSVMELLPLLEDAAPQEALPAPQNDLQQSLSDYMESRNQLRDERGGYQSYGISYSMEMSYSRQTQVWFSTQA